ncbi:MAG: hypothetical protein LBK59_03075 [Bifidobacteriaceae bacterium]|jgi:hypothetical protein|nr:hypothetical protein [Bifidobacteriaceae bacterium]
MTTVRVGNGSGGALWRRFRLRRIGVVVAAVVAASSLGAVAAGPAEGDAGGTGAVYVCPLSWQELVLPSPTEQSVVHPGDRLVGVSANTMWETRQILATSWYLDSKAFTNTSVYRVARTDVGHTLLQVAAVQEITPDGGRCPVQLAATAPITPKAAVRVNARVVAQDVSSASRASVRVKVTPKAAVAAEGKVVVSWKSGKKSAVLSSDDDGVITVTLPRLAHGKYRLTARFVDKSGIVDDGAAEPVTLTVR